MVAAFIGVITLTTTAFRGAGDIFLPSKRGFLISAEPPVVG